MKDPRQRRIKEPGSSGTAEALLAGPSLGCNRFTVRRVTVAPLGATARSAPERGLVYFVHRGGVVLSHGEGELDRLEPGQTAVVHPGERHHLSNPDSSKSAVLIRIEPQ